MIVDDEPLCLDDTVYMLSRYEDVEIAGAFTKPLEALEAVSAICPDVLFLDYSMPKMNGAELAKKVLAQFPRAKLVFVTAFAKELSEVKNVPIFASLLKPLDDVRLREVLARLRAGPSCEQGTQIRNY
jgi:two-component system LytT family response regulator